MGQWLTADPSLAEPYSWEASLVTVTATHHPMVHGTRQPAT